MARTAPQEIYLVSRALRALRTIPDARVVEIDRVNFVLGYVTGTLEILLEYLETLEEVLDD